MEQFKTNELKSKRSFRRTTLERKEFSIAPVIISKATEYVSPTQLYRQREMARINSSYSGDFNVNAFANKMFAFSRD
jgi:hypothetical protein